MPNDRYKAMHELAEDFKDFRLFVCIEPILRYNNDNREFSNMIFDLRPEFVYVGFDNYDFKLPEPRLMDTMNLIKILNEFTEVREKTIRRAWFE